MELLHYRPSPLPKVARSPRLARAKIPRIRSITRRYQLVVLFFAAAISLTGIVSPPYLMDDVDSVQTQIARNMMASGDYVTPHLDSIAYMEKAPLKYWLFVLMFRIFGVHDWAARLVIALAVMATCLITARFAAWAMGDLAGLYAGLVLTTCTGLFLFTRVLIPDPLLTLFVTLAIWCFARALDAGEARPQRWALGFWASMALGVLTKGLIAVLFPAAAALLYLAFSRLLFRRDTWKHDTWKRIGPLRGALLFLLIAAPWHVLATLRNPPYFDFTMHSESGAYHGFFWFYFLNEHLFRFLNLRYPRDYNTVPRPLFWLFHLIWFFPWSVYLFRIRKLTFRASDRASRTCLLALCWIGFLMIFFSLSTTQEYYSLPCYPAIAILTGGAMALPSTRLTAGARVAAAISAIAALVIAGILWSVRGMSAPGDIARALSDNPDLYTLSMGHMADLTLRAFAYLRVPLAIAFVALLTGAAGGVFYKGQRAVLSLAVMMVLFFQAAHFALRVFDPYLGTKGLADALLRSPAGRLIVDDQYYSFSSVFFYANTTALLLRGRVNNLEYGSYAPGAPKVFIQDENLPAYWTQSERWYLIADGHEIPRLQKLLGNGALHQVAEAGNKYLFVNHP